MISNEKVADIDHLSSYFAQEVSQQLKVHDIDRMPACIARLKDAQDAKVSCHVARGREFLG